MAKKKTTKRVLDVGKPEPVAWRDFENEVADYLERAVIQGKWGVCPNMSKVHRKPKYYSADRGSDIIFDVSIEVRPTERPEELLFLWLVECKNYPDRKVTVDEVEEFRAKMLQVGAHKGTICTRFGFDSGATSYAKTHRIGLARLEKMNYWTFQFSASGGAFAETHIYAPQFLDEDGEISTSFTDAVAKVMAPFGTLVVDAHLGQEKIIFDGEPFEYMPSESADEETDG